MSGWTLQILMKSNLIVSWPNLTCKLRFEYQKPRLFLHRVYESPILILTPTVLDSHSS